MEAIALARRLAALGQPADACKAYTVALASAAPEEKMEAAVYILQSGGDYRISYTCFRELYDQGLFREDCLSVMTQAFYEPNVKALKKRYEKNCRLLAKYIYLFRKDFPAFDELPVRFYPYDGKGYLPFFVQEERFGEYINFENTVVSRNFFKDLEKPILADDVYSQYELEYLKDNVRDSERVGRENHVYLHYTDWAVFCAHLQVLNLRPLLEGKKLIFLVEDEIELYPIDFKERFGIDYSQYKPQPIAIREVKRLIWHTQLSAHNGGDFFNEVFDGHPNLLAMQSVFMSAVETLVDEIRSALKKSRNEGEFLEAIEWRSPRIMTELYRMGNVTEKDIFVAIFLGASRVTASLDQSSRIAPAVFFQPHFENIAHKIREDSSGKIVLYSECKEIIRKSRIFQGFPYIKTFTPMRRVTNSYAASVRFMYQMAKANEAAEAADPKLRKLIAEDIISERVVNRDVMIDPEERLYKDSVLVRFEDGKLNPKATFTALAAFLDLPYTESMACCSDGGQPVPANAPGDENFAPGFNTAAVFRTYDEYANDSERYFIEYVFRDLYERYGYDLHFYDGAEVDEAKAQELVENFTTLDGYIRDTWWKVAETVKVIKDSWQVAEGERERIRAELNSQLTDRHLQEVHENRLRIAKLLVRGLKFVNENGQPLRFMPMLEPAPALLEQPLYR